MTDLSRPAEGFDVQGSPDPTPAMLASAEFEAVWQVVKGWDVERKWGDGFAGANGSDVRTILDALSAVPGRALAESFAKTVALILETDPTRTLEVDVDAAITHLLLKAGDAGAEWRVGDQGPAMHMALAEVLMAVAAILAGLKVEEDGRHA